jgi:hypothetical protein
MDWIRRISFELVSELEDVVVDCAQRRIVAVIAHFLQKFFARDVPVFVVQEEL